MTKMGKIWVQRPQGGQSKWDGYGIVKAEETISVWTVFLLSVKPWLVVS